MNKKPSITEIAKLLGSNGGHANVKKHGIDHMKKISKLAAEARRKKREEKGQE